MGLQLTIKEGGSTVRKEELHHLELANVITTLYNHQENLKRNRTLTVGQAQNIILEKAGQNQFFLSRVANNEGHKRQLGLTILGSWDRNEFTPTEVIIEKNDFKKGGLRKKHSVRKKSRNDSADFDEVVQNLLAQDQALKDIAEKSHVSEPVSEEYSGTPPIQVSSMEEDESSSIQVEKKRPGTPNSSYGEDIVYESPELPKRAAVSAKKEAKWEPAPVGWRQTKGDSREEEEALLLNAGSDQDFLDLLDEVEVDDAPALRTHRRSDTPTAFMHEAPERRKEREVTFASTALAVSSESPRSNASPRGIGTSPVTPPKPSLKEKASGVLSFMKWPTISAALTYGLVRALHAARVITATAIGTMSGIWAGVAFVGVAIAQAMRESVKKKSFKELAGEDTATQAANLEQRLPALNDGEWSAFKDGFDAQKSIVNQFKACTRPNDYKNSKLYYSGYRLSELDSDYDLDAIEAKRAKPIN